MLTPFSPIASATRTVTDVSSSVAVTADAGILRIYNKGPNEAFVRWGVGAQTAAVTDMCIPAGAIEVFGKGSANTLAAICAATETATLRITSGEGQ